MGNDPVTCAPERRHHGVQLADKFGTEYGFAISQESIDVTEADDVIVHMAMWTMTSSASVTSIDSWEMAKPYSVPNLSAS